MDEKGPNDAADSKPAALKSDDDLDTLLDTALDYFDKPIPKVSVPATSCNPSKSSEDDSKSPDDEWSKDFAQFQDAMHAFLKEDPNMQKELNQLISNNAAGSSSASGSSSNPADLPSLEEAVKSLLGGTQPIPEPSPEEFAQLFSSMGLTDGQRIDGSEQLPDIIPFMQNVLKSLLSKELLYPSLKDIVDKYPNWLSEKKTSLSEEAYAKYSAQYELMKQACAEFEKPCDDSEDAKKKTFETILVFMQKMQEYGNPPKELIGANNPDLPFDEHGNLTLPGMPEQCTIM